MKCRNCDTKIIKLLSLGKLPLGNGFLKREEILHERKYDLSVGFCPNCYLVQLMKTLPQETLYLEMFYFPSSFESILRESKEMAYYLAKRLGLNSKSMVLDIGSSDGYQLQFFKQLGIKILGVDPSLNMTETANRRGIPTITDFFNYNLAQKLKREQKFEADLIISTHLLNHIDKIKDFLRGVKLLLKPKGIAFFKFYTQRELDIINHEHVFYFSFLSLKNVFKNANLEMYDAEIKNGAMQIFVSHPGTFPITKKLEKLISEEIDKKFNKLETYQKFAKNIIKTKRKLTELLKRLKKQKKRIAAYSAPEKGNILLNYCGIGKKYLDFIVDKSELKQGLYTPGSHLLIYSPQKIYEEKPDYLLILSWNIAQEIINDLKNYRLKRGKFIIPFPRIKIT